MNECFPRIEVLLPTLATKADISEIHADFRKADSATKAYMTATVASLLLGFIGLFIAMDGARTKLGTPPATTAIQILIYVQRSAPYSTP